MTLLVGACYQAPNGTTLRVLELRDGKFSCLAETALPPPPGVPREMVYRREETDRWKRVDQV